MEYQQIFYPSLEVLVIGGVEKTTEAGIEPNTRVLGYHVNVTGSRDYVAVNSGKGLYKSV